MLLKTFGCLLHRKTGLGDLRDSYSALLSFLSCLPKNDPIVITEPKLYIRPISWLVDLLLANYYCGFHPYSPLLDKINLTIYGCSSIP